MQCRETRCMIRKRTRAGGTATVALGARFNHHINWIAAGPHGSLYVVEGPDLRRIDREGRLATVAGNLGPYLMGLWPDHAGNSVYVAAYGRNAVLRVGADGRATTVARTPAAWAPSGALVAPDGALWILEYSTSNQARVRRVTPEGRFRVY